MLKEFREYSRTNEVQDFTHLWWKNAILSKKFHEYCRNKSENSRNLSKTLKNLSEIFTRVNGVFYYGADED